MDSALTSEIERYRELKREGSATQEDWEALSEKAQEQLLKETGEAPDPHKTAYTRRDDFIAEYRSSKCGYHYINIWEQVVYFEGNPACTHDERLYAVLPRLILEFDQDGNVTEDTVKESRKAVKEILEEWVFDRRIPASFYAEKQSNGEKPWGVKERYSGKVVESHRTEKEARARANALRKEAIRERGNRTPFINAPRQPIIDFYKQFKVELASKPLSTKMDKLIETYDPDLLQRAVMVNDRDSIVEKGEIKPTRNTANRKKYAWCLAVFKVVSQNPAATNIPGIDTIERNSYPSRSKKHSKN